jgi:[protein-PII] uridylyltransferase
MRKTPDFKEQFHQELVDIKRRHQRGAGGMSTADSLTKRLDRLLVRVYKDLHSENARPLSIVAIGGYGRRELCFASDVDVMFLVKDDHTKQTAVAATEQFLHVLLDFGLDIGHSYRTVPECIEFAEGELETWLSLMEARFICGNAATYRLFQSRVNSRLRESNRADFVARIDELTRTRHAKYGDSTTLLEPNIKNSAGGLRDLHTILWLMRGLGEVRFSGRSHEPALAALLRSQRLQHLLGPDVVKRSLSAFDFLLRTRNEMHLTSQSHHDTLEFSFQPAVATGLHYRSSRTRTNVERFMQDYYIAARSAAQTAQRSIVRANDVVRPRGTLGKPQTLDEHFAIINRKLELRNRRGVLTNEIALRAFILANEHRVDFSFHLQDRMHRLRESFTPLHTTQETDLFRRLLHQAEGLGKCLHEMNDLGILECWIPEWKPMVAFFQHNMYHYYTADEHTLKVVDNAQALSHATSIFGDVFRSLVRKDVLYLACLFHDIAKPLRIGDHEIVGVEVATKILQRLQYSDALDTVGFLVRYHLVMEQVAFRRNLNDPQTTIDFASRFESVELLDLLFVLTYADLSAVNKNVWTQWKEMLLTDLYRKTCDVLQHRETRADLESRAREEREQKIGRLLPSLVQNVSESSAKAHLDKIENPEYFAAFDATEIAEHIRFIEAREGVKTVFRQRDDFTEVTLIAPDAPYALSHCCAVLTANDANIFDANIFTRADGVIIDKFRVVNFVNSSNLTPQQSEHIQADIQDVFQNKVDVHHLLEKHRLKWKRRAHALNPNIRFDVEFEDHPRFTIIDVFAADRIGFLHRVTETISSLELNISFAKIATRVDGIVDSFYVLDRFGRRIEDERQKELVKNEIMAAMKGFFELELENMGTP